LQTVEANRKWPGVEDEEGGMEGIPLVGRYFSQVLSVVAWWVVIWLPRWLIDDCLALTQFLF